METGFAAARADCGAWRAPEAQRGGLGVLAIFVALGGATPVAGQADSVPTGREYAGLPAVNFDADEGFGYGVLLEMYDYGPGRLPYVFTLQPTVFFTTEGRRDFTLFFDAPHLLPGWRVDAYLAREQQIATPYYGVGNASSYDELLETDANPYYYRYGRTRHQLRMNLQRPLAPAVRGLVGAGVSHTTLDLVPQDSGTTLLAQHVAGGDAPEEGWWNYVRVGVIRDTRDREVGPSRGSWSEILAQYVGEVLGSESSYGRVTAIDRRYLTLAPGLVFANRLLVQQVAGDVPFYALATIQRSFKQQEGLGGAESVRGLPKNRYVGKGLFLWNAELRWRALEWRFIGKPFHMVLSVFVDSGRVWHDDAPSLDPGTLHHGYGGGVRVGMSENFVVAMDAGTSVDAGLGLYIGLGYLY